MTNIKLHINPLKNLEKEFDKLGLEKFCKKYQKYDLLIGDSESIKFVEDKIKEYKNQ